MSKVNELHNQAMDLAELGLLERLRGNPEGEVDYSRQALKFEVAAAQALTDLVEPTFSVLHRSAATIALQCGEHRLAEQLAAKALAQEPPNEIAEELRDVLEQAQLQRHLSLRGVELGLDEVQMSLSGKGVGYGMVAVDAWASRVKNVSRFIERIIERQKELPFGSRGTRRKTRTEYPVLFSALRAGSFTTTLRVGRPSNQPDNAVKLRAVVDEFMDLMEMFNSSDNLAMEERVSAPSYLREFIRLAGKIAPDGDGVGQVGFTVRRKDGVRKVAVTRQGGDVRPLSDVGFDYSPGLPEVPIKVRGTLRFADFTGRETNEIKLVRDDGTQVPVRARRDMTSEIVRSMWDMKVVVRGLKRGRSIHLEDIALDEQD